MSARVSRVTLFLAFLPFLVAAASRSQQQAPVPASDQKPPIVYHGDRSSRMVALTFDACPTSLPDEYDADVVDELLREQVPATLFLSGAWVEKNAARAHALARNPLFEIGEHSFSHAHLTNKTDARVMREFRRAQEIIAKTTGMTPRFFRPPFGEVDERLSRLAASAGLVTIQYDIASGDPDPALPAARIAHVVLREAKGGSIIVFHMNRKGVHTAEVLPEVITGLRKKGYRLVTVGELLKGQ